MVCASVVLVVFGSLFLVGLRFLGRLFFLWTLPLRNICSSLTCADSRSTPCEVGLEKACILGKVLFLGEFLDCIGHESFWYVVVCVGTEGKGFGRGVYKLYRGQNFSGENPGKIGV